LTGSFPVICIGLWAVPGPTNYSGGPVAWFFIRHTWTGWLLSSHSGSAGFEPCPDFLCWLRSSVIFSWQVP